MDHPPHQLHGACACERNQYTIQLPSDPPSVLQQAQIFFDNSLANRRHQAAPVTAWLRVPLDWYSSTTFAHFPDETHARIKRAYDTAHPATSAPARRQFCGYCGTHLTAWRDGPEQGSVLDVTLGSLLNESLLRLEALDLLPSEGEDEDEVEGDGTQDDGRIKHGRVDDEDHIPLATEGSTGAMPGLTSDMPVPRRLAPAHNMTGRGMPYFEDMIETSRLGRIKRQIGGGTSRDGSRTVQWEIVEIGDDVDDPHAVAASGNETKRQKMDVD